MVLGGRQRPRAAVGNASRHRSLPRRGRRRPAVCGHEVLTVASFRTSTMEPGAGEMGPFSASGRPRSSRGIRLLPGAATSRSWRGNNREADQEWRDARELWLHLQVEVPTTDAAVFDVLTDPGQGVQGVGVTHLFTRRASRVGGDTGLRCSRPKETYSTCRASFWRMGMGNGVTGRLVGSTLRSRRMAHREFGRWSSIRGHRSSRTPTMSRIWARTPGPTLPIVSPMRATATDLMCWHWAAESTVSPL